MEIRINDKDYFIEIIYKNNKNMYLRIKNDLRIVVTAPYGTSSKRIKKFISDNMDYVSKNVIKKEEVISLKSGKFEYLGKLYDICYTNERKIVFGTNMVFVGRLVNINNWYKKEASSIFLEYYNACFDNFCFSGRRPVLKIRKMTGKWGVCNITNNTITLNLELIKLAPKYLEYVIYHELCHLIEANHSSDFWQLVSKYVPEYKTIRKEMKNV